MPRYYPFFLDIAGRRVVVVGGGEGSARKVELLLDCGAEVLVISPECSGAFAPLRKRAGLSLLERGYKPGDLAGAVLAIAASDNPALNRAVAEDATAAGVFVNVVDQPALSQFIVPSLVRRGELMVAISTGGASPALARRLREELEQVIGPEYEAFVSLLREARQRVMQDERDPTRRRAIFERLVRSDLLERLRQGDHAGAVARMEALLRD
jgi:precorrin-2 dehydrogenase/sirohydrochlorin ferrochelatase